MSQKNRKKEYDRLMAEADGSAKPNKYHKIPQCLRDEFGEPELAPVEEPEEPTDQDEEPEE